MARVPTPVTQGAQRIGGETLGEARNPYMNVNAPVEAFGGGTGKALQEAGAAGLKVVGGLADIAVKDRADKDRVQLLEIQSSSSAKEREIILDVSSKKGGTAAGSRQAAEKAIADYSKQYKTDEMRPEQRVVVENHLRQLKDRVFRYSYAHEQEQLTVHEKALAGTAIGDAQVAAALLYNDPAGLNTQLGIAKAAAERLADFNKMEGVVKDKYMRDQMGLVYESAITKAAADGNLARAEQLLSAASGDASKKVPPVLTAAQVVQLTAQLSPYREAVKGREEFTTLAASNQNDPLKMLQAIEQVGDPIKRKRLTEAFAERSRITSQIRSDAVDDEVTRALKKMGGGGSITLADIPTVAKNHPEAAFNMVSAQSKYREAGAASARQAEHEKPVNGVPGGRDNSVMDRYMGGLEKTNPDQYIKLSRSNGFRRLVGADQLAAMRTKAVFLEKQMQDAAGKEYNITSFIKKTFNTSTKAAAQLYAKDPERMTSIVVEARRAALEAGKKPTDADIDKALATHLIRVRGKGGVDVPLFGNVGAGMDYSVALGSGIPDDDAVLDPGARNRKILAVALGVSTQEVEDVMKGGMTLGQVAAALGRPSPSSIAEAASRLSGMEDQANDAGFAWEFVKKSLDASGTPLTPVNVAKVVKDLSAKPKPYFEWLERGF
jgi:hypothetical protein